MRIIIDLHPALDDALRALADRHHLSVRAEATDLVTRACERELADTPEQPESESDAA
jgi:plasmid stability protein